VAIEKHILVKRGVLSSSRRREPFGWELDAETAAEVERLLNQLVAVLDERR
jgi:4-hydroxy-tetrahydrodipicolinate synthase